jgi:hypothetical protein
VSMSDASILLYGRGGILALAFEAVDPHALTSTAILYAGKSIEEQPSDQ